MGHEQLKSDPSTHVAKSEKRKDDSILLRHMHDSSEKHPKSNSCEILNASKPICLSTDVGAAKREMDELDSVVDELEDTLDVQDVEDLRELSESMYEGLATIRETHENEESRLPAFLVSLLSRNFRFAAVILERHWRR